MMYQVILSPDFEKEKKVLKKDPVLTAVLRRQSPAF
jgi:hypothetical protein